MGENWISGDLGERGMRENYLLILFIIVATISFPTGAVKVSFYSVRYNCGNRNKPVIDGL